MKMKPINTVSIWNPKGGQGKSMIAINLVAAAVKQEGAFEIPASGVFTRADSAYRTIFDPALKNTYGIHDRRRELAAIISAVLQNLQLGG